ncbi:MAG: GNAT family N-acetyltransferase [Anaeroplasmataceae bacterium]|nr:GNAT family N-acetyltransferase [Anaeroplasmataceae bacterium]
MEEIRIERTLTPDIQSLREEVFVIEQNVPVELEIEQNEDEYIHCCIYKEQTLISYARVSKGHIGRVCVKKEYRHQGYGKKIMLLAEQQISSKEIQIHAQAQARGFYESVGYHAYGKEFLEAGILHIAMKKIRS